MLELGIDLTSPAGWLPLVFALIMAMSMVAYVILDGYDLGLAFCYAKPAISAKRTA